MVYDQDDLRAGLNNYEWCGNETLNSSHWNIITQGFSVLPVATYMSEFG
jgi:1,3-beta-glucanosyltransferase GAS1